MEKTVSLALFVLIASGCIDAGQLGREAPTSPAATVTAPSTTSSATEATCPPLQNLSQASKPTAHAGIGARDVSVFIAGCDDDYYNDTMVAGYVTNVGNGSSGAFYLTVQLQDEGGNLVPGGMKLLEETSLEPRESRKFSVIFNQSSAWKRCAARPLIE